MNTSKNKTEKRLRLKKRIRSKISGSSELPRLSVFKSNKFIYAQIIDDVKGATLVAASDIKEAKGTKVERATKTGEAIAKLATAKKITSVVFDRNGFRYTGRIKALADAARANGLTF